ncbi:MAG: sigma-70 family RNA polymerase sigma factor [Bryobacterales bacterium]|nr:sigma-70 family RNA polymerase sigma factor [Bryobacterales bacterium]
MGTAGAASASTVASQPQADHWPNSGGAAAGRPQFPSWARSKPLDADLQIVERCLAGDDSAWEELIRSHSRRVYGICYRFTGSDAESQDLAQEVFLRLYKSLGSFRPKEGSFQVWLSRMTRNLLIDHYRKSRMQRATDSIEDQLTVLEQRGSVVNRTDALLAGREAGELIQQALNKLSPELRETVILRDLEEMEYREIAGVLQVPEGTVKSRLNRGRAELARLLRRHNVSA